MSVVYKRNLRSVLWSPRRREKSEICANNTFNEHQHHQGTKTTNIWRIVCPLYRGYEIVWMKEVIMLTFSQRIKEWNVCDDPWNWLPSDFIHEMFSNFRVSQFYNLSTDWRFSCDDTFYPWSHNKRMFLLMRSLCAKKTFNFYDFAIMCGHHHHHHHVDKCNHLADSGPCVGRNHLGQAITTEKKPSGLLTY